MLVLIQCTHVFAIGPCSGYGSVSLYFGFRSSWSLFFSGPFSRRKVGTIAMFFGKRVLQEEAWYSMEWKVEEIVKSSPTKRGLNTTASYPPDPLC